MQLDVVHLQTKEHSYARVEDHKVGRRKGRGETQHTSRARGSS